MRSDDRQSMRFNGLQISILAAVAMFSSACFDSKFTKCDKTGLSCPPGYVCSADEDSCIRAGSCGNGVVSDGETCDDGNNQSRDGCSADCTSNESCGNDILDVAVGEICDDGNRDPSDGCNENCESESCGNRTVDPGAGEECDTGPGDSFGCNFDCSFRRCGDGYVNMAAGEECEVMDSKPTDTCDGDCTAPVCGDKYINPNFFVFRPSVTDPPGTDPQIEECDDGENTERCNGNDNDNAAKKGVGDCQKPACGDSYHNPAFKLSGATKPEGCDDGGDTDGCNGNNGKGPDGNGPGDVNAKCQPPQCGDGYHNPAFKPPGDNAALEQCDAGENKQECNGNDNDNATAKGKGDCQVPQCGDGYWNKEFKPLGIGARFEQCDMSGDHEDCNGNSNNFDGTAAGKCQTPSCGDGYRNAAFKPDGAAAQFEACDEGGNSPDCNGNDNSDGMGNCQPSSCGDAYYNSAAEECDASAPGGEAPCGLFPCDDLCECDTP